MSLGSDMHEAHMVSRTDVLAHGPNPLQLGLYIGPFTALQAGMERPQTQMPS